MIPRRFPVLFIVLFITVLNLNAADNMSGYLRLIIHERTGSFSLFYLSDPASVRYEPLFNASDPAASFISVSVNGRIYRLGQSKAFSTAYERINGNPALVFESPFLRVSEIFSPVRTANSPGVNGVRITINIENTGSYRANVGLRMLLDTHLGEARGMVPFITNNQLIESETLIRGLSGDKFWLSIGENVTLMGSILNPFNTSKPPDFVHIANWKRLNDVPWRLRYFEGRSLNNIPYSIGDSAVCYYYEPLPLESGKSFTYSIFLTTEDVAWYSSAVLPPPPGGKKPPRVPAEGSRVNIAALEEAVLAEAGNEEDAATLALLRLQAVLDQFIAGEIQLNEYDLMEIEESIDRFRNRNNP